MTAYGFFINGSSSVFFTIDATPPSILSLSVENKTYYTSDVPLDLTVNEPVSQISYSLDGQDNVTIAGNIGASETICFSIQEPFPTTIGATASASAAIIGIGLLVYFRKRNH